MIWRPSGIVLLGDVGSFGRRCLELCGQTLQCWTQWDTAVGSGMLFEFCGLSRPANDIICKLSLNGHNMGGHIMLQMNMRVPVDVPQFGNGNLVRLPHASTSKVPKIMARYPKTREFRQCRIHIWGYTAHTLFCWDLRFRAPDLQCPTPCSEGR